jgi:hypothetical protein
MVRAGVASYEALHEWSVRNREAYWALAIGHLGIRLQRPCPRVMDLSEDEVIQTVMLERMPKKTLIHVRSPTEQRPKQFDFGKSA